MKPTKDSKGWQAGEMDRIGMEHNSLEVWFRSCSEIFVIGSHGGKGEPAGKIFQGVSGIRVWVFGEAMVEGKNSCFSVFFFSKYHFLRMYFEFCSDELVVEICTAPV